MALEAAIAWRWPGARVVIRGGVVERWDGPMPRPTDAEIAKAVTDYAAVADDVRAEAVVDRLVSAVVWAVLDTYSAPATKAKFQAARTKIVAAYKGEPWR